MNSLMIVINNEFNLLLHIKSAGPCSPSALRDSAVWSRNGTLTGGSVGQFNLNHFQRDFSYTLV